MVLEKKTSVDQMVSFRMSDKISQKSCNNLNSFLLLHYHGIILI